MGKCGLSGLGEQDGADGPGLRVDRVRCRVSLLDALAGVHDFGDRPAGGATLAANYQTLTGKTTAYQDLVAAVKPLNVTTDNPFPTRLYQMHGDGTIWSYTGTPLTGWQMLDNNPRCHSITASGNLLYQMHGDGTIWLYVGPPMTGWQMLDNNPRARAIAASGRKLYQLHDDGTIWIYTGPPLTGWQMLDNNPRTIGIAAGDSLYQLHNDGTIWLYTGTP